MSPSVSLCGQSLFSSPHPRAERKELALNLPHRILLLVHCFFKRFRSSFYFLLKGLLSWIHSGEREEAKQGAPVSNQGVLSLYKRRCQASYMKKNDLPSYSGLFCIHDFHTSAID